MPEATAWVGDMSMCLNLINCVMWKVLLMNYSNCVAKDCMEVIQVFPTDNRTGETDLHSSEIQNHMEKYPHSIFLQREEHTAEWSPWKYCLHCIHKSQHSSVDYFVFSHILPSHM